MYEAIQFPKLDDRPYFYTNFVSTLDGKVDVPAQHTEYWPIGGPADYREFINLRIPADALIHGRGTAMRHHTPETLAKEEFRAARAARGKSPDLLYIVLSDHPDDDLRSHLKGDSNSVPVIFSGRDLPILACNLKKNGVDVALVEGGPHLAASFFSAGLVDEVFLTLAPKVLGGSGADTLTMVEGILMPPERIKNWKLISVAPIGDEVFLRYRR